MYTQISVTDESPPKTKLGGTSYKGTIEGPFELPFPVPHVLVVQRWIDAFEIEPIYSSVTHELTGTHFEEGDEGVCEVCEEWCTVGEPGSVDVLTLEQIIRIQKMGRVCSEECALEYVFGFDNGPDIEDVKKEITHYTSL